MTTRKEFTFTDEQYKKLLKCSTPIPLIALQCGMPPSPQERANTFWRVLSKELNFKYMTVRPVQGEQMKFTAELKEMEK